MSKKTEPTVLETCRESWKHKITGEPPVSTSLSAPTGQKKKKTSVLYSFELAEGADIGGADL